MEIGFNGENIQENIEVAEKGKKIENIAFVSKGNNEIYNEHKEKIIKFLPR